MEGTYLGGRSKSSIKYKNVQGTFSDGNMRDYAAHLITEAIYAEHDDEGDKYVILREILDGKTTADALTQ
jgi:hypothetical protein